MSASQTNGSTIKLNQAQQAELADIKAKAARIPEAKPDRTPAQQAALDEMRAKREASEKLYAGLGTKTDEHGNAIEDLGESIESILASMPSGKRALAAFFVPFTVSFGVGYGIGQLCQYAIGVIATYSTAAAWPIVVMILGAMLAIYAGFKIGQHLGGYIITGQIDRDVARAWNWAFGGKGEKVAS